MVFIGDMEFMLYCKVLDSQRSFLRYPWCNNNDLNVDYETDVHVLRSISSPGYSGCFSFFCFLFIQVLHILTENLQSPGNISFSVPGNQPAGICSKVS